MYAQKAAPVETEKKYTEASKDSESLGTLDARGRHVHRCTDVRKAQQRQKIYTGCPNVEHTVAHRHTPDARPLAT